MECISSSHLRSPAIPPIGAVGWGCLSRMGFSCFSFRCFWLWGLGRSPSIALGARGAFVGTTPPLPGASHASVRSPSHRPFTFRPAQKQSQVVAWHGLRGR